MCTGSASSFKPAFFAVGMALAELAVAAVTAVVAVVAAFLLADPEEALTVADDGALLEVVDAPVALLADEPEVELGLEMLRVGSTVGYYISKFQKSVMRTSLFRRVIG